MEVEEFRRRGKEMVDYMADYMKTLSSRRVFPDVKPGFLRQQLPKEAPQKGESWDTIMDDVDKVLMPGMAHWQSPRWFGYFVTGNAYPSIMGDMLSSVLGGVGFTWYSCPAYTELEMTMTDWLVKMYGLPEEFLHGSGKGGGVIHSGSSEAMFVSVVAARQATVDKYKEMHPELHESDITNKLVAYTSTQAHCCVEKAAKLAGVTIRVIPVDLNFSLPPKSLKRAIKIDKQAGLIPFYVGASLGTTPVCSFDNLREIGNVCKDEDVWFHVDAAYAASALVCPEFKYLIDGVEMVNSFSTNPSKWLLINYDLTVLWVKDKYNLNKSMSVDASYLSQKAKENNAQPVDFRHWTINLGRRFRALKLWFVLRSYGVEGLQKFIRQNVEWAHLFEQKINMDKRFEIVHRVTLGLVPFKLKGDNALNEALAKHINESGKIHLTPSLASGQFVLRLAICNQKCTADIEYAWNVVEEAADELLYQKPRKMLCGPTNNVLVKNGQQHPIEVKE